MVQRDQHFVMIAGIKFKEDQTKKMTKKITNTFENTQRHFYEHRQLNKLKEVSESHHSKIYLYEFDNDVKYYMSRGMNKEDSERYVKHWYKMGVENLTK